jgi:hypothetical protein
MCATKKLKSARHLPASRWKALVDLSGALPQQGIQNAGKASLTKLP